MGAFYSNSCKQYFPGEYFSYSDGDCSTCDAGTYSNLNNSFECSKCPPGTYSERNSSSCSKCPAGTYSSSGLYFKCPEGIFHCRIQ